MSPSIDERTQTLIDEFHERFGVAPQYLSRGPGRVNLIGEHTDYNDGFVLPVALKRDVRFVLRPRADRQVRVYSLEFGEEGSFDLDALRFDPNRLWLNYIQGMAWSLEQEGVRLIGIDAVVSGNVPRGSGLSSSAALEIAAAHAFLIASGQSVALSGPRIAQLAQRAENQFVGVNCGIMDQFISELGRANHALLIDCRSLDYQLVPMPEAVSLVIGNTRASRSLASSAYNERRAQCEEGVRLLRQALPDIRALRDVSLEQLEAHRNLLSETVYRRCRHVVSENERVLHCVAALQQGDLAEAGKLMNASHESLRNDYEVSSPALDAMVEAMRSAEGCYGARLTGAGFGGCAVALVQAGCEQAVADAIFAHYPKATGIWPEVYTTQAADGASVERL
ncbi:galactokinase [Caldilinea sp.]|jgi:galactokinase|uniref:galactokinase n=1 Tax=Caldilinea sp. TaxID=2293560 RepID=UPI001AFDA165|nr:galactokinase [Caldilinea sp.]MBO9391981.1 galactokinase [Caldilinea sp.]